MRKKGAGRGSNRKPPTAEPASMPIRLHAQSSRRLERCGRLRARKDRKKDRQTDTQTDRRTHRHEIWAKAALQSILKIGGRRIWDSNYFEFMACVAGLD